MEDDELSFDPLTLAPRSGRDATRQRRAPALLFSFLLIRTRKEPHRRAASTEHSSKKKRKKRRPAAPDRAGRNARPR